MGLFKKMFNSSKKEIWKQLAADIGGEYIDGGFWGKGSLRYQSGNFEIVLDTYTVNSNNKSVTYTRMRAPFSNKDGFRFKIYREHFFTSIGKFFGMKDIQIGDDFFDPQFIIKGSDEDRVRMLLEDEELKRLIALQPRIQFQIKDNEGIFSQRFPEGVDELYFQVQGVITDPSLLHNLFDLFVRTLERLVEIDAAYEVGPDFKLK